MCHSLTLRQRRSAHRLQPEVTARYENNLVHYCRRVSELCIHLCILVREPWEFVIIVIIRDSMVFEPITGYCISTAVLDQWSYEHPHIKSRMICWVHFNLFNWNLCIIFISLLLFIHVGGTSYYIVGGRYKA